MTINATFQSFSFSAMRLSVPERPTAASATTTPTTPTTPTTAAATDDTVTLSTAAQAEPAAPAAPAPVPTSAPSTAPEVDDAPATETPLFTALDADKDGTMTKEEFTSGALALLGRRGDRDRVHGNGDGDNGRRARGVPGLERRLEKAFERVDANDDGALDSGELTSALAGRSSSDDDAIPPPPANVEAPQSSGFTVSSVSVTYVSVAVQRYTSMQAAAPATAPSTAPASSTEGSTTSPAPTAAVESAA